MSDLKLCIEALATKSIEATRRWNYYDGKHPMAFCNPKMPEVMNKLVVFKKNWCKVIVNATRDRLKIQSWDGVDNANDIWKKVLRKTALDVHVSTLTIGEAYIVAWPNEAGKVKAYYHDSRQAHAIYDDCDPDTMRVACKTWIRRDGSKCTRFINLYYPDRIEHYQRVGEDLGMDTAYQPCEISVEPNKFGVIPVFHFRVSPRSGEGEINETIISLQDALNKLLNDMMVTSEFSAFKQRWIIGNMSDASKPTIGGGTFVNLPAGAEGDQGTSTGTYDSSDPQAYLLPMSDIANAMATISATPKHYFSQQSGDPSGEALAAMEAPLIAKVENYTIALASTWESVMRFCLEVEGVAVADDIECIWSDPHTVQPYSQALTRKTNTEAGIPIVNQLRDEGWTEDQLDELLEDQNAISTVSNIPNPARMKNENVRVQALAQTKDALAEKASGPMADALKAMGDVTGEGLKKGVEKIMGKYSGKQVTQ